MRGCGCSAAEASKGGPQGGVGRCRWREAGSVHRHLTLNVHLGRIERGEAEFFVHSPSPPPRSWPPLWERAKLDRIVEGWQGLIGSGLGLG